MALFLQQFLNGLTLGGVYSLVALGLTLVYGILHVPNFAHGAFYMAGAYVSYFLMTSLGVNYWLAMLGAALVVAVLSMAADRLVFHPLRNSPELHDMIAAIGILLIIGAAFALMVLLHLFLTRTMTGATIMAMAQNREGAALVGIDATRVTLLVFAISGALAAIAATLYAPINLVYPSMGNLVITKAFVIIILGGMGSIPGAIVGGLIIGMAESFGGFYVSTDYKDIIAFVLLVVILSIRPQGLFAGKTA